MIKECILDFLPNELNNVLTEYGEKSYRTGQIFKSLHLGLNFCEMTDISKQLRERLSGRFIAQPVIIVKSVKSVDGTEKFLFKLSDGNLIEGVLMKYKYG